MVAIPLPVLNYTNSSDGWRRPRRQRGYAPSALHHPHVFRHQILSGKGRIAEVCTARLHPRMPHQGRGHDRGRGEGRSRRTPAGFQRWREVGGHARRYVRLLRSPRRWTQAPPLSLVLRSGTRRRICRAWRPEHRVAHGQGEAFHDRAVRGRLRRGESLGCRISEAHPEKLHAVAAAGAASLRARPRFERPCAGTSARL